MSIAHLANTFPPESREDFYEQLFFDEEKFFVENIPQEYTEVFNRWVVERGRTIAIQQAKELFGDDVGQDADASRLRQNSLRPSN